jgi:hypothetical protein
MAKRPSSKPYELHGATLKTSNIWQAAQLLTRISKLESIIAQTNTEPDNDQENDQNAGNTNRNHKALKRPKRG